MKIFKLLILFFLFCTFSLAPPPARAQVMGPALEAGAVDIGFMYKWFHRDMEPYHPTEMRWEVGSFFARYGGFEWLTLSGEGAFSGFEHEDFPGLEYFRVTVGGGLTAKFYQLGQWEIAGCFHYNEVMDRDKSSYRFDKRTYGVIGGLQIGRSFDYRGQKANVWAGPMYVKDVGENYPWESKTPIKNESKDNLGFALGGQAVFLRHLSGIFYVTYADYFQARLGVALHIGS